ncbi:MAG: excinuclease ABC subunit UvrA [Defluviitaleaceae bacterium]|nr:excinuclease ABC subunit UvrA [Defluviitaleaceae bacterium]MCL2273975.1 excinuclease ABC subunit UvrA [Defluviitaleaceae bacterium]
MNIEVIGARHNNLKNVSVEIPLNKLTVITGVSGSGKSSLAFDVIYGEAQRRFLRSLSNFAKSHVPQIKKPNVDYVRGLSPAIAIDQKKGNNNPRSTVGTVTDINDYMRLLFATAGTAKCPACDYILKPVNALQLTEHICALPQGTEVEIYTAARKIYGEDYDFLLEKIRKMGYKKLLVDGKPFDLSEKSFELNENIDYHIEILLEQIAVKKEINLSKSIDTLLSVLEDEVIIRLNVEKPIESLGCPIHSYVLCETQPYHFSFNAPTSACITCMGVGVSHIAEPRFMVDKPHKSILDGALNSTFYNASQKESLRGVILYSLAEKYNFSLDTPFNQYPKHVHELLFYGTKGELVPIITPPTMKKRNWLEGRNIAFKGFVGDLEGEYRKYLRKAGNADIYEPDFVKHLMVEQICPDCNGSRLKPSRLAITMGEKSISELCAMQFPDLIEFFENVKLPAEHKNIAASVINEIISRLYLLADIGLHYLCLGRRSDSVSGGEMQRIKMSTQISSELRGILYVMDEPSIGLHPRDANRIIGIIKKLRDMSNTVVVVEHSTDIMLAADYLIEIGSGAGNYGGNIISTGIPEQFMADENCLSGAYMSGKRYIPLPKTRRQPTDRQITLRGASENNLKNITVNIPLGLFVCVTGVSGSGKSTLIFETLSKHLDVIKRGTRITVGRVEKILGSDYINNVITIDQSPIGRNRKSNPATYVGIYDRIRLLFASTPAAKIKSYSAKDFSLTQSGGLRCEQCAGDGAIVTHLQFMADIENVCPVCKGSRFSRDGHEIYYNGKSIADVLAMTVEEACNFFSKEKLIKHKLDIMYALGLGYLTLGQSAASLSGGEAQRIKLSYELGKIKRGNHNLYILDEPTTGLHPSDVEVLLSSIQRLVEQGHSVIVVEHNLDVIKSADYIIDMGLEGGRDGGYIVALGTPEAVAGIENSYTGQFLKKVINPPY